MVLAMYNPYQQAAQVSCISISWCCPRLGTVDSTAILFTATFWYVLTLRSMLWDLPNKGQKFQWVTYSLPRFGSAATKRTPNAAHVMTTQAPPAFIVWCENSISPWPVQCDQLNWADTYTSLFLMWLLYWRIGGMLSSSSGSCEQKL